MTQTVLAQAAIYLCAAVVAVPIAKRLGLGSVLGYLLAGIIVGPHVWGLVGSEGHHVMHFAEFGVVMMLFLVGLELRPAILWQLRKPIFGLGGAQVVGTVAVVGLVVLAFGQAFSTAVALGMIAACSSTAIVLQSLAEKGLDKSEGGRASFAVLLFQDIAVIPMLAILPLLAVTAGQGSSRPAWQSALLVLAAVLGVVVGGRYLLRPILRFLAETRMREVLTAAALLLVVGVAMLMQAVELSPALGTFLAGVLLADSEYRHQLETDIEPFKGLLLGTFFVTVGATINFPVVAENPALVAGATLGVLAVKAAVLYALARAFAMSKMASVIFAFSLPQVGEFAFVLVGVATAGGLLTGVLPAVVVAVVAITMLLTPLLFLLLERVVLPRFAPSTEAREADEIDEHGATVVMAGFGRVGQIAGRMLRYCDVQVTVLDTDPEIIDIVRRLGAKVYYGDASRLDLLHAAGCQHAKLFILAVDDVEKSMEIATTVREHFPHLRILARAYDRPHYYRLRQLGIRNVVRETFGSALDLAELSLVELGVRAHKAHRAAQLFRRHDEAAAESLVEHWGKGDRSVFFSQAKQALEQAESTMRGEVAALHPIDDGWVGPGQTLPSATVRSGGEA